MIECVECKVPHIARDIGPSLFAYEAQGAFHAFHASTRGKSLTPFNF